LRELRAKANRPNAVLAFAEQNSMIGRRSHHMMKVELR
jgi:hypothetical protein